jgi:hypothetical protein
MLVSQNNITFFSFVKLALILVQLVLNMDVRDIKHYALKAYVVLQ